MDKDRLLARLVAGELDAWSLLRTLFQETCKKELEGVMAKRLESRYAIGQRSDSWLKIKKQSQLVCAVVGWTPSEDDPRELRSLIIAAEIDGVLRVVGKVGSGIDQTTYKKLLQRLKATGRDAPFVASQHAGNWVEPGIYALVSYLEMTPGGELRAPVFERLLEE